MALPKVILYNAISLDGRIDGFDADIGEYYRLAGVWNEDCTLVGSATVLKAEEPDKQEPPEAFKPWPVDKDDKRALLAVVDSRGWIRSWWSLRTSGFWRDVIALCSETTPVEYFAYLQERHIDAIVAGSGHVDLKEALEQLSECHGVRTVRVDSGGTLNGILLRQGLVSEISVLIHPALVGGDTPATLFKEIAGSPGAIDLKLIDMQKPKDDLVWLRYSVNK